MSLVLHPPAELRRPSILTAWAAVAVADAVERLAALEPRIKWPNDLLVNGQKICGILIEQGAATVVGIGLNLDQSREEFDAAGLPIAASLASLTGKSFDLRTAAEVLLACLDLHYDRLLIERTLLEAEWRRRTGLLNAEVEIERSDGARLAGRLREMTFEGLELERPDGERVVLIPESVEHVAALR